MTVLKKSKQEDKKMKNTNPQAVPVKTRVNAGHITLNHNETVAVKTRVNAGALTLNHNETTAVKTRLNANAVFPSKQ